MRRMRNWRGVGFGPVLVTGMLLLAACGGQAEQADDVATEEPTAPMTEPEGAEATPVEEETAAVASLADACGDRVVLQTDWFPEVEHFAVYQLAGPGGEFDAERGVYTNERDGVTIEVRAGGPFIGFQGGVSTLYQDPDILAAYVAQDEAVRTSGRNAVVQVVAPFEVSPQILMWDPEVYDFQDFADIGESDATVLYFQGAFYIDYLVGQGFIRPEQLDASYDGSPARFIAEGDLVQQGFVTSEPYKYENEILEWGKPVDFFLIHDSGFEIYPNASLTVRKEDVEAKADCLAVLVPMIQQATVDFMTDPSTVIDMAVEITAQLEGWQYSEGVAQYAYDTMKELELVSNGPDDVVGNFDLERAQRVVDLLAPIYEEQNVESWDPEVTAEDVVTNQFIDDSIGLP